MKLFGGKVTPIASEVVRILTAAKVIEAESPREVERDVESVLEQYLQAEREVNERAKNILDRSGRGAGDFGRVRALAADEKGIKVGEDMLDYLLDQVVQMFHYSSNVDEIYCEDVELRRRMAPVFKKHLQADAALDSEVRAQLRHVQEGSRDWDIEYGRQLEILKRKKGLV
jgi:hypothetical protein